MSSSSYSGGNRQPHSRQYAKPSQQTAGRNSNSSFSNSGTTVWTGSSSSEAKHEAVPSIVPEGNSARREASHHSDRGEKPIYQPPARRGDISPLQARKDPPISPAQSFEGVSDDDLIGRITAQLRSGGGSSLTSMVNTLVTRNQDANSSALAGQIIENVRAHDISALLSYSFIYHCRSSAILKPPRQSQTHFQNGTHSHPRLRPPRPFLRRF